MTGHVPYMEDSGIEGDWIRGVSLYSKPTLLRPPLCLRKNGLYSGVVLLLSYDKEEINEMGL